MPTTGRHLSLPFLLGHVAQGITTVYPFPGAPPVELLIEGSVPRLSLRTPYNGPATPFRDGLKNVHLRSEYAAGQSRISVSIEGSQLMVDGHAMLCTVADRIQLDGLDPMKAIAETLRQWREVLASRVRISTDQEVGLFGELLFLEALWPSLAHQALVSWRGAANEEHDFGLTGIDAEVKTTTAEKRHHWISSGTQLVPSEGRVLALISVQITRGGLAGRTLPALIEALRAKLEDTSFEEKLAQAGWDDSTTDLFADRWVLRSESRAYLVDDSFPAITPARLANATPDPDAVTDLHYRLDLSSRVASDVPGDIQIALNQMDRPKETA